MSYTLFIIPIFVLICGWYTLTYGMTIFIKEKNKLGGIAVIALAILSTIMPVAVMFIKRR
jgi:hypothetical protein